MSNKMTAQRMSFAPELRRYRANMFTAFVMQKIGHLLEPDEDYPKKLRDAHDNLFELFYEAGFDVITDEDRRQAGLEPRGELGFTDRELHIMENVRIQKLLEPVKTTIDPNLKAFLGVGAEALRNAQTP